jgi:2-amino-4-hydroxy-6-hydroxymethyldihydropteridine diphosphokinase
MAEVYISLGSNLGDRGVNLQAAIGRIESFVIRVIKKSSVIETEPVDFLDQPMFFNQIIIVETELDPEILLSGLQKIENDLGRIRDILKGPRTIDLDILYYDNRIISTKNLIIPHKGILDRKFILDLLVELNPSLIDPVSDKKILEIQNEFN